MDGSAKSNSIILVTGASGFIGKNVLKFLPKYFSHCQIVTVSRTIQKNSKHGENGIKCDLFNSKEYLNVIKKYKPEILIHLAWEVTPKTFWWAKENIDWVYHTTKLFKAFAENNGKKFLCAGSINEFNLNKPELRLDTISNTLYGQSKQFLRDSLFQLRNTFYPHVKILWPQIPWVFGENEPKEKLFSQLLLNIQKGLPVCLNSPYIRRPHIYAEHIGECLAKCITLDRDVCFLFLPNYDLCLEDFANAISKLVEKPANIVYRNINEIKKYHINTNIIPNEIKPLLQNNFEEDLKKFIRNFNQNETRV